MKDDTAADDQVVGHKDFHNLLYTVVAIGLTGLTAAFGFGLYNAIRATIWSQITRENLSVALGLPAVALAALIIVALFRVTEGQIRLKALGLEFEGASGPIVMWVFCFLAMVGGLKVLMS